uniref:ABC-type glutathione-S-conjugate transporter n=1 Tax=Amphimedon queenslandica TaxID=400682 RepID=A0A1X7VVN1_AMPQE
MFGAAVLQSIILHQYFHSCFVAGMRIRSGVIAAVYRKALTLSNKSRQNRTVGEVVNLMSVDAQRFMDFVTYMHYLWSSPLQIVLSLIFLYATMGPSIFAGFGVMILLVPLNMVMAALSRRFQVQLMTWKDSRIKIVNEVLNGIKVIKLYAWEIPFKQMIMGLRKEEVNVLKKSAYANASFSFTWTCAPFMVALATFATYSLVHRNSTNPDDRLTAEKAFVALSLFNILRFPLSMLPMVISSAVEASVSVKRMSSYLKGEELDPNNTNRRDEPAVGDEESVSVTGGSFTWDTPERPALHNIDLSVKPGELVAVVGPVGAGKSSLISALLGEMDKLNGQVVMRGSVAYVPQQAWIQNATVKDNILFGKPLNPILYGQTVQSCALETDLEILPGGDMTEIGEKGINLSGGQKQRVSLARAVYQESDVYLLDDPLSAVDSHVGKHIFDKVIGPEGVLKGKVRILVTHGIGFLSQCDKIIVMSNGRITEVGSYNELIDQDGTFAELLHNYGTNEGNEEDEGNPYANEYAEYEGDGVEEAIFSDNNNNEETAARPYLVRQRSRYKSSDGIDDGEGIPAPVRPRPKLNRGLSKTDLKRQLSKQASIINDEKITKAEANERTQLIGAEKVETGTVKFSVFIDYAKACTYYMSFIIVLFTVLSNGASVGQNLWLAHWSNGEENSNSSNLTLDLGVYASLGVLQGLMVLFSSFALAIGSLKASVKLHDGMLSNILRSPMSFFDTTPLGRILNRFSKDIYTIDEAIPRSYKMFLMTLLSVASTIIVISIASPWFLIIIVPLMVLYVLIQRFYVATSRQLKRLESSSRSPIYSHFQESISGATSIRAYSKVDQFQLQSEARVDYNQIAYYPSICANRWLAIRLEFLGNLIILFASLFAVLQRNYSGVFGSISPGIAGLSISYALQVTQALNWMVRMTSELETNIVAVERTKEYSETPTEVIDGLVYTHTDDDVWRALETAHLSEFVGGLAEGLEYPVAEGGENLSVGQRQLVCLARALLRKTKILVLDEATAAVDLETDDLIQKTIRKEFAGCTVLTIAHRLNTIMDYDKIMVLDAGCISEFDSPNVLLERRGLFYGMAKDAGLA